MASSSAGGAGLGPGLAVSDTTSDPRYCPPLFMNNSQAQSGWGGGPGLGG